MKSTKSVDLPRLGADNGRGWSFGAPRRDLPPTGRDGGTSMVVWRAQTGIWSGGGELGGGGAGGGGRADAVDVDHQRLAVVLHEHGELREPGAVGGELAAVALVDEHAVGAADPA